MNNKKENEFNTETTIDNKLSSEFLAKELEEEKEEDEQEEEDEEDEKHDSRELKTTCYYNEKVVSINEEIKNKTIKPILILINPHSGRGKSVFIFKEKILPFLIRNKIEHEVFITESNLRVETFIKNKKLDELLNFKSIIVVSGDGLFHELLNSIMLRADFKEIIENIPLGAIPTGSGNGLAYTLIRQSNNYEKQSLDIDSNEAIKICCEQAIQDEYSIVDLVKISIKDKIIWSFLSIGWGLLADIDIDSEWLRRFGELRFTIYGLLRSITSVSYNGKLSYLLGEEKFNCNDNESKNNINNGNNSCQNNNDNNWTQIEGKFACLYAVHQAYISSETRFAPNSTLTDELIYLTFVKGKLSPSRAVEFMLAIKDGSHDKLSYVTVVAVKKFKFLPLEKSKIVVDGEVIPWTTSDGPILAEVVPKALKLQWNSKI